MNKRGFIYSVLAIVLFALYLPIDVPKGVIYSFKTFVDDLIPLWTSWTVIYISYFLFLLITWIYFFKLKKPLVANNLLAGVIIACILAYSFYLSFQNMIITPDIPINNLFDALYMFIKNTVPPYNAFPSLHVAISLICSIGYFVAKSKYKYLMMIWAILIILSTMLAKQHYFLDVVGGIILGVFSYNLARYLHRKH